MMIFKCWYCERTIHRKRAGEGKCRCGARYVILPGPTVRFWKLKQGQLVHPRTPAPE